MRLYLTDGESLNCPWLISVCGLMYSLGFPGQMFDMDVAQQINWSKTSNPNYFFFPNYLLHARSIQLMLDTYVLCAGFEVVMKGIISFCRRKTDTILSIIPKVL